MQETCERINGSVSMVFQLDNKSAKREDNVRNGWKGRMVVERHEERGVGSPHSIYVNTSITPYFLLDFHLEFQRSA